MLGRLSNLIKTVRPDGKEVDYLRYGSGHLHGMLLDKERIVDYERDDNHREVKRHWAQDMLQTTAYDAAGRLANQHTQSGKYVKKSILNRDYQYDGANQLINIKDSRKGELSYRYDPIGRLINAKGPLGEETFSFDPAHNILSKEHSASSTAHHQTENTLPSGISKVMGNLLRHIAGSHFDYDQRGNLIKKESAKGIQTFDWDGFNQMKSTTFRGARAGSKLDTQYRYDVFGRRIGKRVVDVRTKEVLEQTLYDWDGLTIASEDRIGEQLAVQAQIRKESGSETRKLSSEVQYLYEDGEFVPLVQYMNTAAVGLGYGSLGGGSKGVAPAIYHYVNDQIGTPQILMNAEQEVVWEAQAKAWGDTIISAPVSDDGVINNHRFQGQYFDAESELHYNTFRYYDPEIGRFISLDPIGLLGGLNNYQYAPNPVEWVDPWGLFPEWLIALRDGGNAAHREFQKRILSQGTHLSEKSFVSLSGKRWRPDAMAEGIQEMIELKPDSMNGRKRGIRELKKYVRDMNELKGNFDSVGYLEVYTGKEGDFKFRRHAKVKQNSDGSFSVTEIKQCQS
ncbi:RHS repeat-associated core domain-containing protein [Taylorella equigenitalis]|uniref:RHS repeat-associated core domain-containing protein n=1 Tax=Taylorella equigenitalis TaxID=29575 RepID=UPI0030B8FCA1